jgi:hypothetical protein
MCGSDPNPDYLKTQIRTKIFITVVAKCKRKSIYGGGWGIGKVGGSTVPH